MSATPGPWDASRDGTPEWHYQATVSDESGDRVATAFVSEANARLIAAAPTLLDAVRKALHVLSYLPTRCDEGTCVGFCCFHSGGDRPARDVLATALAAAGVDECEVVL